MLFIALLKQKEKSCTKEGVGRRVQWQYPEGVKMIAEYWLQTTTHPNVISIFEANSVAPMLGVLAEWDDLFEFNIVPAVTAKEGLELAKQMMRK